MKKKNMFYLLATLLVIAGLIGSYGLHYFTRRRMGMARYVLYKNRDWEGLYPMDGIIHGAILVFIFLSLLLLIVYLFNKKGSRVAVFDLGASFIMAGGFVAFSILQDTQTFRAYYFILMAFGFSVLIQMIKTAAVLFLKEDQKKNS
ncbi:MAG: hypothetical protein Q4G11_00675 [Gallicola sp.]|nr:hypothetical protein [Gallicola sp.]